MGGWARPPRQTPRGSAFLDKDPFSQTVRREARILWLLACSSKAVIATAAAAAATALRMRLNAAIVYDDR